MKKKTTTKFYNDAWPAMEGKDLFDWVAMNCEKFGQEVMNMTVTEWVSETYHNITTQRAAKAVVVFQLL